MNVEILEAGPKVAKRRSVFDFDGVHRVVPFLWIAFGKRECSRRIVRLALSGLRHVTRGMTRDEPKARLTSTRVVGRSCRCENKVVRLEAVYGPLTRYRLGAWSNTRGDHALPAVAQDEHGRHFHPARRRSRSRFSNTGAWGV